MKKSGFICLIVFALVVILCALFCSIKFKKKDVDVTLLYQDFISDKKYFSDFGEAEYSSISYTIYDLNKDGVLELIIYLSENDDFGTNLFYTYSNDKIVFIDKVYHFGNLVYNESENSIVYTNVRPSLSYGSAYGFYKLNGNKFESNKTLVNEIENGVSKYFMYRDTDDKKEIPESEYNKYFDNNFIIDSIYVGVR